MPASRGSRGQGGAQAGRAVCDPIDTQEASPSETAGVSSAGQRGAELCPQREATEDRTCTNHCGFSAAGNELGAALRGETYFESETPLLASEGAVPLSQVLFLFAINTVEKSRCFHHTCFEGHLD